MRRSLRNTLITASVLGVLGTSPAYADGNGSMSQEEIARDNKEVAQLALTYLEERDSLKQELDYAQAQIASLKQEDSRVGDIYLGGISALVGVTLGRMLRARRRKTKP